jgi:hypothetical protein
MFVAGVVDVPNVRDQLADRYLGDGLDWLSSNFSGTWGWPVGVNTHDAYRDWLITKLRAAELFFVTPAMTAVARQAALSFPRYALHENDVPTDIGFVVFAEPVSESLTPTSNIPVLIRAALWATCAVEIPTVEPGEGPMVVPGVHITVLNDTDALLDSAAFYVAHDSHGTPAQIRVYAEQLRREFGPLSYHEEVALPFIQDDEVYEPMQNTAIGSIIVTWLLMTQPLAEVTNDAAPRAVIRRYKRQDRPPPHIRTVTLRQPRRAGGASEGGPVREYHHRWIVRGHWRNHWFPSLERHKPVYIPSHVKGPVDAPLIGGERVNVLRH